jgi:hypothetical protein
MVPALHFLAIDAQDRVAGAEPRLLCNRIFGDLADHRLDAIHADHVDRPVGQDGENEIEQRARDHDGHALPDALAIEGPVQLRRRHIALALVQHLHVAAERERPDGQLHAVRAHAARPQRFPEAHGETQHLDAQAPRHPEMAELMHRDQNTQGDHERAGII